jgi:hypothetical protein
VAWQLRADRRGGAIKHMIIDAEKHTVIATDVDLAKLARKLDVLQPWEKASPHHRRPCL